MKKYKSVFISDIHLFSQGSEAKLLCNFLDNIRTEKLFLIGDIIDGWKAKTSLIRLFLNKKHLNIYCNEFHLGVIRRILSIIKNQKEVVYIIGNHDDFLINLKDIKNNKYLKIERVYDYKSINGKKFLLLHGDQFDLIVKNYKILAFLGDLSYKSLIILSKFLRWTFHIFGYKKYWSLSYYIKKKVKNKINVIYEYEKTIMECCKSGNYDGVICGHSHIPCIKYFNDIIYMNCGDWVDSCTAIIENYDGSFELIKYREK